MKVWVCPRMTLPRPLLTVWWAVGMPLVSISQEQSPPGGTVFVIVHVPGCISMPTRYVPSPGMDVGGIVSWVVEEVLDVVTGGGAGSVVLVTIAGPPAVAGVDVRAGIVMDAGKVFVVTRVMMVPFPFDGRMSCVETTTRGPCVGPAVAAVRGVDVAVPAPALMP
jgi:hypothetical protein